MFLKEQYTLYQIAHHFLKKEQFSILTLNENAEEIWLEKHENKKTTIIRLVHNGFDWQNHLRQDIARVFQTVHNMQRIIKGKNIELHNVYVTANAPVDDWERLKKPMQLKEKRPIKMKVYYLDEENFDQEIQRLQASTSELSINIDKSASELVMEEVVKANKQQLIELIQQKKNEYQNIFSRSKPFFTYCIMVINVLLFILLEMNGGSTRIATLIEFGAKYNPAILENNEWWRIISSTFLHIGVLHLIMNMLAVYYLGTIVERIYGRWRFLLIYFLAGIGGGLASLAFTVNVSAGASGAIFGLFGALLFFGLIYKRIFFQTMGYNILLILAINLIFGLFVQQIDMAAHLGGLLAGFIASAIVYLPKKSSIFKQLIATSVYLIMLTALLIWGYENNIQKQAYQLMVAEDSLQQENYQDVVDSTTLALNLSGDLQGILLFHRSYAYIELNEINLAIADLEKSLTYEKLPESYYNLAILYYNTGELGKAEENIVKAYDLNPDNEGSAELYEVITGESPKE